MEFEQWGPLFMLLIGVMVCAGIAITAIVWWKIVGRTGYHPALSLLMFVPLLNLVLLIVLAFQEWPVQRELAALKTRAAGF